jgi:hypothetical protein
MCHYMKIKMNFHIIIDQDKLKNFNFINPLSSINPTLRLTLD